MTRAEDMMGLNGASDDDVEVYGSSDEESGRIKQFSGYRKRDDDNSQNESENEEASHETDDNTKSSQEKVLQAAILSEEQNKKRLKEIKKSGVVYLSTIPPYMKPIKLRQILERFGTVGRIYLSPEDSKAYSARVKAGGNRKKKFVEGWAEYLSKKHAKLAVEASNGNPSGGKKGSFYYDDIINMKYLPKFKWHDLTEQIALEAQERQEKLKAEIAQATRENRVFIDNVEKKERIERSKKKAPKDDSPDTGGAGNGAFKRKFDQKPVKNTKKRATESSSDLQNVLSKVF